MPKKPSASKPDASIDRALVQAKVDGLKQKLSEVDTQLDTLRQEAVRIQNTADRVLSSKDMLEAQIKILQSLLS